MTYSYGNGGVDPRTVQPGNEHLYDPSHPFHQNPIHQQQPQYSQLPQTSQPQITQSSSLQVAGSLPLGNVAGAGASGYVPMEPSSPVAAQVETQPDVTGERELDWNQVLNCLHHIAAHEIAGVCLYSYFKSSVSGIWRAPLAEMFDENATESLAHYHTAQQMIVRVQGAGQYLAKAPDAQYLQSAPLCSAAGVGKLLEFAIAHETKAVLAYSELYELVAGEDAALENWALSQIETETRDLTEFQQVAGDCG